MENFLTVAGNDFGEGEREGPFEIGFQCRFGLASDREHLTALFSADGELRNQHFTSRREKFAATQRVEDGLPAIVVAREFCEPEIIDVHVCVGFEVWLHAE